MCAFFRRLRARLKYRHFDRDLARELESHRAMAQDDLEARGVPPEAARPLAARALGNVAYMREEARSVWIARWLEHLWQDVRYAGRGARRQPVFCLTVIGVLGLGLGLVTTAHAVIDAMFLRPWQVPNGPLVYQVRTTAPAGSEYAPISFPELRFLQAELRSVEFLAATLRSGRVPVYDGPNTFVRASSLYVSANYFDLLGVRLTAGRAFLPVEDDFSTPLPVAVIGERLWTERFGRDPSAIGRGIRIGGEVHTIVGVAPAGFMDPHDSRIEVWRPITLHLARTPDRATQYGDPRHPSFPYAILAKLATGVTVEQAAAELTGLGGRFRSTHGLPPYGRQLRDTRPGSNGEALSVGWLILAALVLLQLVACANVSNLLLGRALARQREMAVRVSLGAGRARLVRQLATETGVLAATATVVGVGLAFLIPALVVPYLPEDAPRPEFFWPGGPTIALAMALTLLTTAAAGLAPALRATRINPAAASNERHGPTASAARLQRMLLATQIAIATLLLTGTGIFTRAVTHASNMDPGFALREYLEIELQFPAASSMTRRAALLDQWRSAMDQGGWPPVAIVREAPMQARNNRGHFLRADESSAVRFFPGRGVSRNYFDLIQVPMIAGRMPDNDSEIVINRAGAALLWPGESAVGRTVLSGFTRQESEPKLIVGIAPDLPSSDFTRIEPVAYTLPGALASLAIVRSRDTRIAARVNDLVSRFDPDVTAVVRPLEDTLDDVLEVPRIGSWVGWSIGAIGLLLAMIGAFGVFAQSVERRRREIGIRLALGAGRARVVWLVLAKAHRSVAVGLAIGLALAITGAVWMRSVLYGLSPLDPLAYVQVVAILAGCSALATWIPARRAVRVDPAVTLRQE